MGRLWSQGEPRAAHLPWTRGSAAQAVAPARDPRMGRGCGCESLSPSLPDLFQAQKGTPIMLSSPHQDTPHTLGASRQALPILWLCVRPRS